MYFAWPWTVYRCTVHSWQIQQLWAEPKKKKKKKKGKNAAQNVDAGISAIQTVTIFSTVCLSLWASHLNDSWKYGYDTIFQAEI